MSIIRRLCLSVSLLFISSCSTVYYSVWETLGQEKRDLLKSNIEKTTESQNEVKEEFKDTISKIRSEYKFDAGHLETTYDALAEDYSDAKSEAKALSARIDRVESIATDLFAEWQTEIGQIKTKKYRVESRRKLAATKKRFKPMLASMRRVEASLDPILDKFNDQVLFLKHNLNAAALGSFKAEFRSIEKDIRYLVNNMEKSTKEADQFISTM
ncbi:MAG: DUF2959 domain-containing protein [Pseudobacteriovorax sp.]|nr:DUF2959 domain-containing protein [Pseudobacteriovorax sp.]